MRPNADTPITRIVHRALHEAHMHGIDDMGQIQRAIRALLKAMPALGTDGARVAVERVRQ